VAELEGELQTNKPVRTLTPPTHIHRGSPADGNSDLTAFNKLISLMQAGAARPVESPKQPVSPRSSSFVTLKNNIKKLPHPLANKILSSDNNIKPGKINHVDKMIRVGASLYRTQIFRPCQIYEITIVMIYCLKFVIASFKLSKMLVLDLLSNNYFQLNILKPQTSCF
jgi:hypothetical protein